MESESLSRAEVGSVASQISREIVRLHARLYGRGPTKAKTYLNDDYVMSVLEEVFTPAEKTLIGAGNAQQVSATRDAFQAAIADDFIAIVEQATGRRVRAFTSQVAIEVDAAIEVFLLDPPENSASSDGAGPG